MQDIDFKSFDISKDSLIRGDSNHTPAEYEAIYADVAKRCNESGEYMIDCFNGRYTVRKISEVEQIHYAAMTDEQKVAYDKEQSDNKRAKVRFVRNSYLRETDPCVSCPDYPITDEERQAYKDYRSYLRDYTETEEWWLKNPMTFDEWINQETEGTDV